VQDLLFAHEQHCSANGSQHLNLEKLFASAAKSRSAEMPPFWLLPLVLAELSQVREARPVGAHRHP
jgi:hypothetical protein